MAFFDTVLCHFVLTVALFRLDTPDLMWSERGDYLTAAGILLSFGLNKKVYCQVVKCNSLI